MGFTKGLWKSFIPLQRNNKECDFPLTWTLEKRHPVRKVSRIIVVSNGVKIPDSINVILADDDGLPVILWPFLSDMAKMTSTKNGTMYTWVVIPTYEDLPTTNFENFNIHVQLKGAELQGVEVWMDCFVHWTPQWGMPPLRVSKGRVGETVIPLFSRCSTIGEEEVNIPDNIDFVDCIHIYSDRKLLKLVKQTKKVYTETWIDFFDEDSVDGINIGFNEEKKDKYAVLESPFHYKVEIKTLFKDQSWAVTVKEGTQDHVVTWVFHGIKFIA
jgi:hypothetical protein